MYLALGGSILFLYFFLFIVQKLVMEKGTKEIKLTQTSGQKKFILISILNFLIFLVFYFQYFEQLKVLVMLFITIELFITYMFEKIYVSQTKQHIATGWTVILSTMLTILLMILSQTGRLN